jgi:hypothetical protein
VAGDVLKRVLILAIVAYLAACDGDEAVVISEDIVCPPPSVLQIEPWGKSGAQQICKIKHGPFIAWEDGYIHLRGNYENGEKSGTWKWYDRTGIVVKEINYSEKSTAIDGDIRL